MTTRSRVRTIGAALLTVSASVALVACTGGGGDGASPSASAAPVGKKVSETCGELLPSGSLDVYGKTFAIDRDYAPEKGSPAARIAEQRGRVCRWAATDDAATTITLAVADLPEKSLTNLKDALYERGGSVPTYRVEGYFSLADGVGRADAFADPYWITASSPLFSEPGGAQPVIDAVRGVVQPNASATPAG
ncbi:hypothetical protein DEJ28_10525 [Curtobacterium sp. MCPF17_002]|uniref:hypothetical protein n=1 Tax=Curtobacterium sp. MCPF17_002 TaxID=2175645 RepID=UPI000DA9B8EF|nr:hypothetical protein [Curtobacterium sp. MCPF17_002]WIB76112.1 hypothetical protein DEJ28_10525 [Curtobacterium sp. MCPF17_002]